MAYGLHFVATLRARGKQRRFYLCRLIGNAWAVESREQVKQLVETLEQEGLL